jgi:hypothetical protein
MVITRQRLGPWRPALNWNCTVFLLGSLAACIPTFFVVAPFVVLYPDGPPRVVEWWVLRLTQLMQCFVIAWAGGKLALWYFHRYWLVSYGEMQKPMLWMAGVVLGIPILAGLAIALQKYGATAAMLAQAATIYGAFVSCFLVGSFHYARKLRPIGEQGNAGDSREKRT